jgi:SpoVK/Ycf46/Vps4 family AAA+-type ATPase
MIEMPDSKGAKIIDEFIRFSTMRDIFEDLGYIHKRGTLLWGPPGSGKTCLLNQMSRIIREDFDGIVVYIEKPVLGAACLEMLRKTEPDRPILVLLEDFEEMVRIHGEASFLSLLDGESQISNVMYVATTNYPERLDKRFTDRPSRFDNIVYIGMPKQKLRREFLKRKLAKRPLSETELERWVQMTKGYSMAHMREVIISVLGFGHDLESTIERLNKQREGKANSDNQPVEGGGKRAVGFTSVFSVPDEEDED